MKFGLFYLFSDFGNIPQQQIYAEVLDEIEHAESLGFESVWLPEHHFAIYGMLGNPLVMAAAVAQRTKKMKIGTAVVLLPFQHPMRLAEDAALVDTMSGGRLLLGVGRGYQPIEFHGFGVDQGKSSAMFEESFQILKDVLSGKKVQLDGEFWKIEEPIEVFPKPLQLPPPLYLASVSSRSIEVAARHGISLLRAPQFSNLDTVNAAFDEYTGKLVEYGHDPNTLDQPLSIRVFVAPTNEEAKAEAEHALWFYHLLAKLVPGAPGREAVPAGYEDYPFDPAALSGLTVDDVWDRGTAFGTPERVTEILKTYMHKTGSRHLICQMRIGGLEHDKVMRSMELFTNEVMPALREEEARLAAAE
ncbi:MAG: LLM class flavin-dependent oxidoreductase [Alphaproteobacteria bacterium]|jgi:alkanesulfonate monooxygenase SsuD/methylene tetrahydromethanopterin reductase-like flavin-dependent oxidoreductase (luciferase family)|nr:LLM class flavin-dependent oxidoreductase [Alphaproteobacteria bacterium]